jgi:osmotically inducible protein OsmC
MENQTAISVSQTNPSTVNKVLYTGKVHTTGGREGAAKSEDNRLDIRLSAPGTAGTGTNPEQLFAAGWSACFIGAMQIAASSQHVSLPAGMAVNAEVDLAHGSGGYSLQARLFISLPGLSIEAAKNLAEAAHVTCPYSKATQGNINVQLHVIV